MSSAEGATTYELYSTDAIQDPYPAYADLRREGDVVKVAGIWHATSYKAVDGALRNPKFGRGHYDDVILRALGPGPLYESFRRWMLHMDPPDHTRLRGLVSHAFTPRSVEAMRGSIAAMVEQLMDAMATGAEADFITEFAYPLPVQVICELLGVPDEDHDEFRAWSTDVGRALQMDAATPEIIARGNTAVGGLDAYFRDLVASRRARPQDTFLDALIAAEDDGATLSDDELLATVVLLFFAGHETTVNLLGNGLFWLHANPSEWSKMVTNPSLVGDAVEESLRFDTPVQRVSRVALEDLDLCGTKIAKGEMLRILVGSAHRDAQQFADAETLDITRGDQRQLAFGSGAHFCLGSTLARLEANIAFDALVRRFPTLEVLEPNPTWRPNRLLRGIDSLPIRLASGK
jgi:cytochrome P450